MVSDFYRFAMRDLLKLDSVYGRTWTDGLDFGSPRLRFTSHDPFRNNHKRTNERRHSVAMTHQKQILRQHDIYLRPRSKSALHGSVAMTF